MLAAVALALVAGCAGRKPVHHELRAAADGGDVLALSDALEALIARGGDTPADREYAYAIVRERNDDTAAVLFARAVVTGRFVQEKGLLGANLIGDMERCARRSRQIDPSFRDGAATRLLGTLYVMAPRTLLTHGDSETGLDLLEELVTARPDVVENHLRVAEAYIALGDPDPARQHLCQCLARRAALRRDEQHLLDQLVADTGALPCRPADAR